MKLLIVRHGESEDDLTNSYGGWADFDLTKKGRSQAKSAALEIAKLGVHFDLILTSPLKRAMQTASILADNLKIKTEVFEYIKERNTNGIMSGMVRTVAKEKYPWLVESLENGDYVDGSEREIDIKNRVKKAYELIKDYDKRSLIIVTHGVFMNFLFPVVFGKKLVKKGDASFILLDINRQDDGFQIVTSHGIELQ
jgi:2,3-bisphosphoglycerate-dependent phosphoglycerate mutase